MTNYEVLYIVSPKMEEAAREELIARFAGVVTAAGGTAEVNKWGMRKLAYKIDFMSEGYYVLMTFTGPSDLPAELERQMRISDAVMRFVTTKKVENKLTRAEAERKAKKALFEFITGCDYGDADENSSVPDDQTPTETVIQAKVNAIRNSGKKPDELL